MRYNSSATHALLVGVAVSVATALAPAAGASVGDGSINGTYLATSDGVWAKTDDQYRDAPTVTSVWTVSSSCPNKVDCTGQVTSDQGWTLPLTKRNTFWVLVRDIPQWLPCPDGTFAHGTQRIMFYPLDDSGNVNPDSSSFAGHDKIFGDGGNCGRNQSVVLDLPFTLVKQS